MISVVIPSLRQADSLLRLVEQLRTGTTQSLEILIADNGLPPEAVSRLRAQAATVLSMGRNLGFGTAVNRAAREARGDILVVLNDDIAVQPGFLDALVAPVLDGAEMAAGILVHAEAPDLIESAGIVVDRTLSPHDYLQNEPLGRLEELVSPPLGPCGGAAAYRRSAFASVGGFDEAFFAYCEDLDLALRLVATGARCALSTHARAMHIGSGTLGYGSVEKATIVGHSRGYLLHKYGVLERPATAAAALAIETATSLVLVARHRSLQPTIARVRGWRSCSARAARPPASLVSVGLLDGMHRRLLRSRRKAAG